jgi:hypothetical protein
MYIVRRVQSRIEQATLEMKMRIRMTLVEKGEEGRRVTDAPA